LKRFVLVDRKSNRVCGDTSAPGPNAETWNKISAHLEHNVPMLAVSAARLLDQNAGKTAGDYIFTPFVPKGDSDGYLIFECNCDGDHAPLTDSDPSDPNETIYTVMTSCLYIGYVRRALTIGLPGLAE
jgi:hypothetical protein